MDRHLRWTVIALALTALLWAWAVEWPSQPTDIGRVVVTVLLAAQIALQGYFLWRGTS